MANTSAVFIAAITSLTVIACSSPEPDETAPIQPGANTRAQLIVRDRSVIGSVAVTQGATGVVVRIIAQGLPSTARGAWHGVHLHETGNCSSEDFTSSGGHINPSDRQHGLLNAGGPDNADLPNIWVGEDGTIHAELYTSRVSLNGYADMPALLDEDGSALVIHAGADNMQTQPIGGAGARIACAVLRAG
jgi:Cu-Zn family superoxide dismutase